MKKHYLAALVGALSCAAPLQAAQGPAVSLEPLITFTDGTSAGTGDFPGHGGVSVPVLGKFDATRNHLYGFALSRGITANAQRRAWFWRLDIDHPVSDGYDAWLIEGASDPLGLMLDETARLTDHKINDLPLEELAPGKFRASATAAWYFAGVSVYAGQAFDVDLSGAQPQFSALAGQTKNPAQYQDWMNTSHDYFTWGNPLENSSSQFSAAAVGQVYDQEGNAYFWANYPGETTNGHSLLIQRDSQGKHRLLLNTRDKAFWGDDIWAKLASNEPPIPGLLVFNEASNALYFTFGGGHLVKLAKTDIDGFLKDKNADSDHIAVSYLGQIHTLTDSPEGGISLTVHTLRDRPGYGAVSDGFYLYGNGGNNVTGNESGIWRYDTRKPFAEGFKRVHTFLNTEDARPAEGAGPKGPMVKAGSYLYGVTTVRGATDGTNEDYGTLFRIKLGVDDAAGERGADTFEHLHSFAENPALNRHPNGLSAAGYVKDEATGVIRGRMVGTTRQSGAGYNNGWGGVFQVLHALEPVTVAQFEASAPSLQVGKGETLSLSWNVRNTVETDPCVIAVSRSDGVVDYPALAPRVGAQGAVDLGQPAAEHVGEVTFTLTCNGNDGQPVAESRTVAIVAADTGSGGDDSNGGGGGDVVSPVGNGGGGGGTFSSVLLLLLTLPGIGLRLRRRQD